MTKVGLNVLFSINQCVPSQHYASTAICVPVVQCNKPTQRHLRPTCSCPTCCDDDCGHVVLTPPEGLLILYRSGIFAIDTSIVNFQTCPRHRDNLGVYCKRWRRTYRSPSHPSLLRVMQNVQEACRHQHVKIFGWNDDYSITFLPIAAGKSLINC